MTRPSCEPAPQGHLKEACRCSRGYFATRARGRMGKPVAPTSLSGRATNTHLEGRRPRRIRATSTKNDNSEFRRSDFCTTTVCSRGQSGHAPRMAKCRLVTQNGHGNRSDECPVLASPGSISSAHFVAPITLARGGAEPEGVTMT
jgi:hypothetical protein